MRPEDDQNLGDAYCFVAIERDSKLVLNFAIGKRDQATTDIFIEGLRLRLAESFQITTDGFAPYRNSIPNTLEDRVDFAQCIKVYRAPTKAKAGTLPPKLPHGDRPSYGPTRSETHLHVARRTPEPLDSHGQRRFTRLTNGFSKKWENHWAALALLVRVLQLLPGPQIASRHACDASRDSRSHLERARTPGGSVRRRLEGGRLGPALQTRLNAGNLDLLAANSSSRDRYKERHGSMG